MPEPDYFSLQEFRTRPQMSDGVKYPDERVLDVAAEIVGIIEREVGTSFIGRAVIDEVHDGGTDAIVLGEPFVLSATSATEDGVAVTDDLRVRGGVLRRFAAGTYTPITWAAGIGNIAVSYLAGYSATPPPDIKGAAMAATRARLLETAADAGMHDRRTSLSTDQGVVSFVVPGEDRPTGYPSVDAVILGWKARLDVLGFA